MGIRVRINDKIRRPSVNGISIRKIEIVSKNPEKPMMSCLIYLGDTKLATFYQMGKDNYEVETVNLSLKHELYRTIEELPPFPVTFSDDFKSVEDWTLPLLVEFLLELTAAYHVFKKYHEEDGVDVILVTAEDGSYFNLDTIPSELTDQEMKKYVKNDSNLTEDNPCKVLRFSDYGDFKIDLKYLGKRFIHISYEPEEAIRDIAAEEGFDELDVADIVLDNELQDNEPLDDENLDEKKQ